MTIQDPITYEDSDESSSSQPVIDRADAQTGEGLSRTASGDAQASMGGTSNPSDTGNPKYTGAVPAWESSSAAAWVKLKSLEKSQSTAAQINDWAQQEQEEQLRQQQAERTHSAGNSPALGRGMALGGLHIEVEEAPQQDGLPEWTESGLDDIAAAVAQYTGASPTDLLTASDDQQDQALTPKQQQLQIAKLRSSGSNNLTMSQSPAVSTGKAYAAQQEQLDAEFDAAMTADAEAAAAPRYANAQEQMEAELEAAMAAEAGAGAAPQYANAQEQMEAELEAAMAADAGQAASGDAETSEWQQMELDAAVAAEDAIAGSTSSPASANTSL